MISKKIHRCKKCPYYSEQIEDYDLLPPLFSLQYLQKGYDLKNDKDSKVAFFDQMFKLSQIPWKQINQAHRHGLGYEKINQSALKVSIPKFINPDVTLIAFRFDGLAPMIGFRDKNVFYVLWFDTDYNVYKH